jgi:hypothetical protein
LITKDIRLLVLKIEGKYLSHLLIKRKRVCQLISKKIKNKNHKKYYKAPLWENGPILVIFLYIAHNFYFLTACYCLLHTQLLKEHVQNGTKFAGTTFHSKGLHFSTLI